MFGIENAWAGIMKRSNHMAVVSKNANSQPAAASAIKHGISSIIDNVEIDLLKLMRISHYRRQHRLKIPFYCDVVYLQVVVAQCDGIFQHAAQVNMHPSWSMLPGK